MVEGTMKGLARVKEILEDRPRRVKELQEEGRKIFGYLCIYPPLELMTAVDIVPYRVFGDMREPITSADTYLPTISCPFLRSCLDLGLKGKYDFFDGMITTHICDVGSIIGGIWNYAIKTPYSYHIDVPHTLHQSAIEQEKKLLSAFKESLEEYTGRDITPEMLKKAIGVHNKQRALVRKLYDYNKSEQPLMSGSEMIQIVKTIQSIPVDEGNLLLEEIISEVQERQDKPEKKAMRLLVWGSVLDDTALTDMIESLDANIVMDDTCVGTRPFFGDVEITDNLIDGLAKHYLVDIRCPRTFRVKNYDDTRKDYMADLENRFSYIRDFAEEWKADGVILESVRYCDTHGYEVPGLKDYLTKLGIPSVYLEHDYTEGALAQLRTRVQGFLEIIS